MPNILLVEDNPQHAALALRILQSTGVEIEHVDRATRAIQAAQRRAYSLILMDLELPDMTGQTACMIIRKYLRETTPPIIALTSHDGIAYRQSARQAGCQAFISKPYSPMLLMDTVRYFVEKTALADVSVLLKATPA